MTTSQGFRGSRLEQQGAHHYTPRGTVNKNIQTKQLKTKNKTKKNFLKSKNREEPQMCDPVDPGFIFQRTSWDPCLHSQS